jgi:hypothetical protein
MIRLESRGIEIMHRQVGATHKFRQRRRGAPG